MAVRRLYRWRLRVLRVKSSTFLLRENRSAVSCPAWRIFPNMVGVLILRKSAQHTCAHADITYRHMCQHTYVIFSDPVHVWSRGCFHLRLLFKCVKKKRVLEEIWFLDPPQYLMMLVVNTLALGFRYVHSFTSWINPTPTRLPRLHRWVSFGSPTPRRRSALQWGSLSSFGTPSLRLEHLEWHFNRKLHDCKFKTNVHEEDVSETWTVWQDHSWCLYFFRNWIS